MRYAFFLLFLVALAGSLPGADKKLGVLWYKKSGMAKNVMVGMVERLKEAAPEIAVEVKADLPSEEVAGKLYDAWQSEKDGIVFLRSDGATYLKAHPPKVPAFIGAANNPELLGVMPDMTKPDGLITGVTYYLPADKHLAYYQKLFPDLKKVALLVEEGHPSAPIEQAGTKAACEAAGLTYLEAVCADKKALALAIKKLTDEGVDLLIMGNQKLLIDQGAFVAQVAGTTPVVSYSEKPVMGKFALAGVVVSDHKLGRMLGDAVIEVLVKGKPVAEVPVQTDPAPRKLFVPTVAEKIGLALPEGLEVEKVE